MRLIHWCLLVAVLACHCQVKAQYSGKNTWGVEQKKDSLVAKPDALDSIRLKRSEHVRELRSFNSRSGGIYSDRYAILIDMSVPSYRYRFTLMDLKKDSVLVQGLVGHGAGSETGIKDSLIFGNIPESYKTSLGIYKVGVSYQGVFGKAYRLHGLEASNSNAFKRAIVFHQWDYLPNEEQTEPIANSLGCPMVSPEVFKAVDAYIQQEKKPLLMEIYYKD